MQKDIKTQSLIVSILFLAFLLLGYFVTFPAWKSLSKTRTELARAELDGRNLNTASADLEAFLQNFERLEEETRTVGKALPSMPAQAVLLGSIEALAKASGFALSAMNIVEVPENEEKTAPVYSVVATDLQISGSGSYFSFKDFLRRLERHLRLIDIKSINFEVDEANNLQVQFEVRTYYQK